MLPSYLNKQAKVYRCRRNSATKQGSTTFLAKKSDGTLLSFELLNFMDGVNLLLFL